jgi:hypothetical protein
VGINKNNPVPGSLDVSGSGLFSGSVGIGTTSPQSPLVVAAAQGVGVSLASGVHLGRDSGGTAHIELVSAGTPFVDFSNDNAADFDMRLTLTDNNTLDVMGGVLRGSLVNTSDARYKQNIATVENALETILNLRGVSFDWNREAWQEKQFPAGRQIGFLAQEVEQILPEIVHTDGKGYKGVNYANLVPVLVEAMKQQQKQIEKRETQLSAQQQEIDPSKRSWRH